MKVIEVTQMDCDPIDLALAQLGAYLKLADAKDQPLKRFEISFRSSESLGMHQSVTITDVTEPQSNKGAKMRRILDAMGAT